MKISTIKEIFLALISITTLIVAFFSLSSSNEATIISNQSLNISQFTVTELKNLNEKISDTNVQLEELQNILNFTNMGIKNLEPQKPHIFFTQDGSQMIINGSIIKEYCKILLNCSFNPLILLDDSQNYSLTMLKINNDGNRASNLVVNLYYYNKDFAVFGKDLFADKFGVEINPVNKIIKLNINQLGITSNVRFWVFTNVNNISSWPVQYDANEISSGNDNIGL